MDEKKRVNQIFNDAQSKLAIQRCWADMENIIENYKLFAKLHREKYNALISEGFKEHEALELCKIIY